MKLKLLLALLALSSIACAQTNPEPTPSETTPAKIPLTFQTTYDTNHNIFKLLKVWADSIQSLTNNEVSLSLLPHNYVVESKEMLQAVELGALEGLISSVNHFKGDDPAYTLLGNMAVAWATPRDYLRFINSESAVKLMRQVHPKTVRYIGAYTTGMESLLVNQPVSKIDDFRGQKIRTPPGLVTDVFRELGANPVRLEFSEVKTSLRDNLIMAADYSVFSTNHKKGMHKFAPNPIYPGFHSMPMFEIAANETKWKKISPESRKKIRESVAQLALEMLDALEQQDRAAVENATRAGVKVTTLPDEEIKKFRKIARDQWEKFSQKSDKAELVYYTFTQELKAAN